MSICFSALPLTCSVERPLERGFNNYYNKRGVYYIVAQSVKMRQKEISQPTSSYTNNDLSLYKRINQTELTKKEQLVAQYLLDNRSTAGFMTASGIARELGISDVTVIRFARKLGYAGFSSLQEALQQEVVEKLTYSEKKAVIPQDRLNWTMESSEGKSLFQLAMEGLVENIAVLTEKNSDEIFERAAQIIFQSHRKAIAGFRGCMPVAESFSARLSYMLDDVYPILFADPSSYSPVFNLRKGDCLVVIGFEDYQTEMVALVRQAQKHGVSVIALTDKETSPLAFRSNACIYCSIKGISFNSFSTPLLATEVISAHLVKMIDHDAEVRNAELLEYMEKSNFYWNHRGT